VKLFSYTERFTDLDKLNLQMMVDGVLKPIFETAPFASENYARFKSGQK